MYNGVAVGAYWHKVCFWIYNIRLTNFGKQCQMMNVNIAIHLFPVELSKVKATHLALRAMNVNALLPSCRVSFVGVNSNLP